MANIQTWNGTATFSAGMTPFGFYDNDSEFQTDIIKVAKFCGQRLGYPLRIWSFPPRATSCASSGTRLGPPKR